MPISDSIPDQFEIPSVGELLPGDPADGEDGAALFIRAVRSELDVLGVATSHAYYNTRPFRRRYAAGGIVVYGVQREPRTPNSPGTTRIHGWASPWTPTAVTPSRAATPSSRPRKLALPGDNAAAYALLVAHRMPAAYAAAIASSAALDYVHFDFQTCAGCGWVKPGVRHRDKMCRLCLRHTPQARAERERLRRAEIPPGAARAARPAATGTQLTVFDALTSDQPS